MASAISHAVAALALGGAAECVRRLLPRPIRVPSGGDR